MSVAEDGKPHCRIEMCNVAQIGNHASRTTLEKCVHGCATRYAFDLGHIVQDGVLDAPTEWTVRSVAGGAFSANHTGNPVKCAVSTLANTDILMHNTQLPATQLHSRFSQIEPVFQLFCIQLAAGKMCS